MLNACERINTILKEAKKEQKPYPQTFLALKEAGVTEYTVAWQADYEAVYKGNFGECHEAAPAGFMPVTIASDFSLEAAKQAVRNVQQKKTNYVEFLAEIGAAGVSHYRVDMQKRTVTYYDPSEKFSYMEVVPEINK